MHNIHIKVLLGFAMLMTISGCGGGGGGGETSSGSINSTASSTPSAVTASTTRIADIQIDHSNNLASVYDVEITVSLPHLAASQVYISVCDNAGGGIESINYDNCLLKAALQSGAGNYQLRVPNHCESLIAVVNIMEPNTNPLIYTLSHNNQAETTWLIQ
ncbi:hypothetical protein GCM10007938_11560 [Vibrio zhanjiangensis]|uniref:Lipoprotein n=1 Tax=Vibrio zhanjiangensis TaxID=1046128 RepID=A0ABQ6EWM8_9VIBR|nr:hypothetical protein [Vibrio zhanjiangensis]GLT17379.1 hypothetical protein GCM10007938_11560 [Vibrio zhanjiangensis]